MKKIISIIIAAVAVSLLTVTAFAGAIFTEGDYNYTVEENGAYITIYHGTDTEVTVPEKIGGETVVGIKSTAFYNTEIVSVTLPDSITDIEDDAFLPSITVYQNEKTIIEAEEQPKIIADTSASSEAAAPESDATEGSNAPDISNPDAEVKSDDASAEIIGGSDEKSGIVLQNGEEVAGISLETSDSGVRILLIVLVAVFAAAVVAVVITIVVTKKKKG